MKLKKAITEYLKTKETLTSYPTYKSVAKLIKVNMDLDEIDLAGDLKTSERKRRINKTRRMFHTINDKMGDKSQNSRSFAITMVKSSLKHVEETNGSLFWKSFSIPQENKDIIIMTPEFVRAFINDDHKVYDGLSDKLKSVHDLSCVMLTTALRFGDAMSVNKSNLENGRITIKNKKTGVVTSSPIPIILWDKLQGNLKNGYPYTVKMTRDDYYDLFPKLFCLYPEICKDINGSPMYDVVRYHIFRKSAISLMLANGLPESVVKRLSGHSINSKSFERYVHFTQTMYGDQVNDFQKNFYG